MAVFQGVVFVLEDSLQASETNTEVFQFAILADRTGGMRPGVFEEAVGKSNLLQPDFVMSVGDLIDGYTTDPYVWEAQWNEFDKIIDKLEVPFYPVAGNHDISNSELDSVWRKRYGSPWYGFVHKNVLFIVLHTEDIKGGGISPRQVAEVEQLLGRHSDVVWTLIFMHRPLWSYSNRAGYEAIETALEGRPYSVFSGHHHHYMHQSIGGRDHYVLATCGGGSYLRGAEFGEMDHLTWVTVTENGPRVGLIELDGIHYPNIVNKDNVNMIQELRNGSWLNVDAVLSSRREVESVTTTLQFHNKLDQPMRVFGLLEPCEHLKFDPEQIELFVQPYSTVSLDLVIESVAGGQFSLEDLNNAALKIALNAEYVQFAEHKSNPRTSLSLPASKRLLFDWPHRLRQSEETIQLDGRFDDWANAHWQIAEYPLHVQEDWDWSGPEDGRFRFAVLFSGSEIFIAIEAVDDVVLSTNDGSLIGPQDKFVIQLDQLVGEDGSENFTTFEIAMDSSDSALVNSTDSNERIRAHALVESMGDKLVHRVEVAIRMESPRTEALRLNVGWMDHDRPENSKPSILWWRPKWGGMVDFLESGRFNERP